MNLIDTLNLLVEVIVLLLMSGQNLLLLCLVELTVLNLELLILEYLLCFIGQFFTQLGHVDLVLGRSAF